MYVIKTISYMYFETFSFAFFSSVLVWGLKIKGTAKASSDVKATRDKHAWKVDDWISTLLKGLGHAVSDYMTEFFQLVP